MNKMVKLLTYKRCDGDSLQYQIQTRLPTCIHPTYWLRHKLSMFDINLIIQSIPAKFVWLMAMTFGYMCQWSDIQPGCASLFDVNPGVKSGPIEYLIRVTQYQAPCKNVLVSGEHIPPIPQHIVSEELFRHISTKLVDDYRPLCLYDETDCIPNIVYLFEWVGLQWVPVRFEGDCILCTGVEHSSQSEPSTFNPVPGYTHQPMVAYVQGELYFLTDESILVKC